MIIDIYFQLKRTYLFYNLAVRKYARMKIKSTAIVLFLLLTHIGIAQKIKYKDLFPVLNAKNYEEGGPKLVQYLSDPKNQEDANPNYQMALMLEDRLMKYNVVSDTAKIYATGDSAISYFNIAKTLIDEKELKRNDEYYQSFFRRDLRTGDFGIKVSDVHLDIENQIAAVTARVSDVKSMHEKLNTVARNQRLATKAYQTLVSAYSSYYPMLLSASAEDQTTLMEIERTGKLSKDDAANIKDLAKKLGSDKYQEEVEIKEIANFGVDGMEITSVKEGSISLWDFESWARNAQSELRGGIGLFKTMINNYSQEIREKKTKVKNSQDVEIGVFSPELQKQFDQYDPESVVEKLLRVEMHEAKVMKYVDLQINPALMDSAKIGSQLAIYSNAKANVDTMNLLVESITTDELNEAKKRYPDYINSFFKKYGTASKYVQEMTEWSRRNRDWIGQSVQFWSDKNKWGIIKTEGEPERMVPLVVQDAPGSDFYTFGKVIETIPEIIVYGADFVTKKGYVSSFGEDRVQQWTLEYPLPGTEAFKYVTDTLPTANGAVSFYVYNKNASENNFSAVSFTNSGSLNWAVNTTVSKDPVAFKFDDLTQELTILLYPEEKLPLDSDELGYLVIDRTGNVR